MIFVSYSAVTHHYLTACFPHACKSCITSISSQLHHTTGHYSPCARGSCIIMYGKFDFAASLRTAADKSTTPRGRKKPGKQQQWVLLTTEWGQQRRLITVAMTTKSNMFLFHVSPVADWFSRCSAIGGQIWHHRLVRTQRDPAWANASTNGTL